MAVAAVVVLGGGIGAAVAFSSSGSGSPTSTPSVASGHPSISAKAIWRSYGDFTDLIGASPRDTASAYQGATCAPTSAPTSVLGILDQVECTGLPDPGVEFTVSRFASASLAKAYLRELSDDHYSKQYWRSDGQRRGLLYISPSSASYSELTSSICAMPAFLVRFHADDSNHLNVQQLRSRYWEPAPFPNFTPQPCT